MKKMANVALALLLALLFYGTAKAGEVQRVKNNQRELISSGVASGQLTRHEAQTLKKQQAAIAAQKHCARADGVVTKKERARIHRMQANAGHRIYRLKHNRQHADPRIRWHGMSIYVVH